MENGPRTDHVPAPGDDTAERGAAVDGGERSVFRRIGDGIGRRRAAIASNRTLDLTYRAIVGVVGTIVLVVGIIAIPYPGPGWLIVFAGLGILASEFDWAHRILHVVRGKYDTFMAWFGRQSWFVRGLGALGTAAVVVATLWVLGTFGLVGGWVGLHQPWLQSPF
ncbi:hypothetical protein Rrhod_2773 [Rhodococcus rhodnii LMG 5362]|uniref:TIGR02611 family protein n=1 Tax=Rhodococcus rhodnii LMG 5362 TaxID=1273125 RepID=R7WKM4_9NOCA|nr:hypothetical protein Rrhod_2773 [Rhodococcus rhodnii LMG 5362]